MGCCELWPTLSPGRERASPRALFFNYGIGKTGRQRVRVHVKIPCDVQVWHTRGHRHYTAFSDLCFYRQRTHMRPGIR